MTYLIAFLYGVGFILVALALIVGIGLISHVPG